MRSQTYTREMIKALLLPWGVLLVTACAQPEPPRAVGMANPASVYCQSLGGKIVLKSDDRGQFGICHLPDGTQIDEWELFRRDHPAK